MVLALKKLDRLYGSLVVHADRVRAVLGGRLVGESALAGVAHTIALFVNRATASFRALVVRRPVS